MPAGLRLVTQRSGDGAGQPMLDSGNGEELMHVQPEVSIVLGNRPPESPGTLYISTKQVLWLSDADRHKGYAVDFYSVSLHAVSRDPEAYPSPCIYTQNSTLNVACNSFSIRKNIKLYRQPSTVFGTATDNGYWISQNHAVPKTVHGLMSHIENGLEDDEPDGSDTEYNGVLDLSKITEMRLVPSDPTQLETLFDIFCECAELNPDQIDVEEEEHNWIFSADQMEGAAPDEEEPEWISQNPGHSIGFSNGDHDLAHSVLQLQINDQRFQDAEEMDSDSSGGHH